MKTLYEFVFRKSKRTTMVSVRCNRGQFSAFSTEKAIPPIIEYSEDGSFRSISLEEVIKGIHTHPYKASNNDFNAERLSDLEVASFYKQLEHFPTLPTYQDGDENPHPIAEEIYSSIVYLKPVPELATKLSQMSYLSKIKEHPKILERVVNNVYLKYKIRLDLFSVPKKGVGTIAYIADEDGISTVAKMFSFGMHRIIPADRIARELSSLKSAERFLNPVGDYNLPEKIAPFVSTLRVAIVGTAHSMLDSGDLYPSARGKIACNLSRIVPTKDLAKIPYDKRRVVPRPFRSGVELVHEELHTFNEMEKDPGTIRLIFPSGVKVAAQFQKNQMVDEFGESIDILLSFETFAKKGALACFLFDQIADFHNITLDQAKELFLSISKQKVYLDDQIYEGYIVNLPVMRPGQRYTELSKPSDRISMDLIAKAIVGMTYTVPDYIQYEYDSLVELRTAINNTLNKETNE